MKIYSYFPGCTLKTKARELDVCARASARALGFELEELPDWQCCGAVYPQAKDELATRLSPVRALARARDLGRGLVTVCSACHHVLKRVNRDMASDEDMAFKVQNYLKLDAPYRGETKVVHLLELLRDEIGFDEMAKRVKNPLDGKLGAYYGCLLLRPGREMEFDDPENPSILEDFLRALGAEPVYYANRNECCGGYTTLENKALAVRQATAVADSARAGGAERLVTACPLCLYNLTKNAQNALPTVYFTELLAEALGVKEAAR